MNKKSEITTLIFDFGGVIINLDLPQCISNLRKSGFTDVDRFLSNFGQKDFFLQYESGQIDTAEFRNQIRKNAVNTLTDEAIDEAWCSFLCDIPETKIELLRTLRKKYRLLLLSNTNPLHIETSAAKALEPYNTTLDELFDKLYLSCEIGLTKPSVQIFEFLLKDAGVTPEECLFLDDGPKNIETAQKMGFETYLVTPGENLGFLADL